MVRKIQKTFDWEVMVRCLAAGTILYVVTVALLSSGAARLTDLSARRLAGG